jgi:hypothetical protein
MRFQPFRTALTCTALAACFMLSGARADLIVDDFTSVNMTAMYPGSGGSTVFLNTVFGRFRSLRVSGRNAASGTVMSASIDAGLLTGNILGTSNTELSPLFVGLGYFGFKITDLSGYVGLAFDFTDVQGAGDLVVLSGIGGIAGIDDTFLSPDVLRIPITAPGQLLVPFSSVNLGPDTTLDAIQGLGIRFESTTEHFAFTLDEFRLIPEPSTLLLVLAGGGIMAASRCRRRRGQSARRPVTSRIKPTRPIVLPFAAR